MTREEETFSSVEIDFADKSSHRTVRITDRYGFTMAALCPQGVVFASPSRFTAEDGSSTQAKMTTPSTVFFRPFEAWAQNSEWLAQLPEGEDAVAVVRALGSSSSNEGATAFTIAIIIIQFAPTIKSVCGRLSGVRLAGVDSAPSLPTD